ncbi:MAG: HAMP domain-containing protein [Opitutaceae bacterium]|nr:HAMP domain-containing protein [Opitutaceae bacterium]
MISGRIGRGLRHWLRGKPVRHKFGFITVLAVTCAALAASAALLAYRLYEQRGDYEAETIALTRIVAENANGSVSFLDRAAAESVLATLRAKPAIRGAVIDIPTHPNFAIYGEPPSPASRLKDGSSSVYDGWLLHTTAEVGDGRSRLGTVHLVSDLRPMLWAALQASLVALVLALVLALLLSLFVIARLRGVILDPVDNLHAVTRRVTENADFSQRAEIISGDEMGELTQAFNRMLDRLQAKESELRSANAKLTGEIEERARLEAKLLETSRQAGMAQVATGVLHNVGNVLNSVNISANILRDNLGANPRLKLFKQVADLLREQGEGLPRFLAEDPRGRLVPKLVIELAEQMQTKQTDLQRELEHMVQNVDHIKQIVAMQQSYAKAGGVVQTLKPATLFEEATRLAQASVDRHGVRVTPYLGDAPEIESDRHQILQILVNFITNAVQAVKQRPDGDRRVALSLSHHEGRIQFTVEDNGAGIPAENLQKIFQHGFTTRRDGHGFGLHSGALAARNLGGTVHVHSDGPGLGARFTLDLPLRLPAALPRAA